MSGRHVRVSPRRAKRHAREQVDDYDAETLTVFADMNRPLRSAQRCVRNLVGSTYARTRSIPAALAMTRALLALGRKHGGTR